MSYFLNWNGIEFKQGRPGMLYKTIAGKNMQMFCIKLQPGQKAHHIHPAEQMGYILSGQVELTVGKENKLCKAGDAYYIPCNMEHGFKVSGTEDVMYIEIFSPPKEEHKNL